MLSSTMITTGTIAMLVQVAMTQDNWRMESLFEKRPEHRVFDFHRDLGYGESSRQFRALETINNREFEKNREHHRNQVPKYWGLVEEKNAIFKGELSCYTMIGSDGIADVNAIGDYEDFQVTSVEVIDEETGQKYPYVRQGDDFIAYNPNMNEVTDRRFIKVVIKHRGCVGLPRGCNAVTNYVSSYKPSHHHRMGFTRINLAVRFFSEECSLFRRIFNFWPFN